MVGRKGDKSGKKAEEPDVIASRASRTEPSFLFNGRVDRHYFILQHNGSGSACSHIDDYFFSAHAFCLT
jgi:hypothetical protein